MPTHKFSANNIQSLDCIRAMLKVNHPIQLWLITPNVTNKPQRSPHITQTFTPLSPISNSNNWVIIHSLKDYSKTAKVWWCKPQAWWSPAKTSTRSSNYKIDLVPSVVHSTWSLLVLGTTSWQRVTSTQLLTSSRIWRTKNALLSVKL